MAELESLVATHPYRERLREQLILALYRSGRQADALEAYRAARETLVEELGVEPSQALQELERADPSPGAGSARRQARTARRCPVAGRADEARRTPARDRRRLGVVPRRGCPARHPHRPGRHGQDAPGARGGGRAWPGAPGGGDLRRPRARRRSGAPCVDDRRGARRARGRAAARPGDRRSPALACAAALAGQSRAAAASPRDSSRTSSRLPHACSCWRRAGRRSASPASTSTRCRRFRLRTGRCRSKTSFAPTRCACSRPGPEPSIRPSSSRRRPHGTSPASAGAWTGCRSRSSSRLRGRGFSRPPPWRRDSTPPWSCWWAGRDRAATTPDASRHARLELRAPRSSRAPSAGPPERLRRRVDPGRRGGRLRRRGGDPLELLSVLVDVSLLRRRARRAGAGFAMLETIRQYAAREARRERRGAAPAAPPRRVLPRRRRAGS